MIVTCKNVIEPSKDEIIIKRFFLLLSNVASRLTVIPESARGGKYIVRVFQWRRRIKVCETLVSIIQLVLVCLLLVGVYVSASFPSFSRAAL